MYILYVIYCILSSDSSSDSSSGSGDAGAGAGDEIEDAGDEIESAGDLDFDALTADL